MWTDIKTFILSVKRHWVSLVTSSIFAASGFFYEHTTKPIPIEIVWGMAIIFLFVAAFLAWRDEYHKVLTRQQKRIIRDGLAGFHERGISICLACERMDTVSDQELYDRFAVWDSEAQAYLQGNLDRSYMTRFNNPVGLNLQYSMLHTQGRTNTWRYVANRIARLQQFMDDYRDS
mgnify:CR=1 FL=1